MPINQTYNQYVVKRENKSLVLCTLNRNSPLSRAKIAQYTGLNKSTVSSLVNELLQENLIYESGPGQSRGGRKPVMLYFNELAGFTIGVDLGVNYLLGILTDLDGNIVKEEKSSIYHYSYSTIEAELFTVIDNLIAAAPVSTYGIVGIGIGVPGVVNKQGSILLAPNLGWENVDLKTTMEERYQLPVSVENEAKAGAYGEKRFGAGKNYRNIVYVSIGIGIGVGIILNGTLYQGSSGFTGEMGHMTIKASGEKCRCGNIGCWELYASEQALLNKAESITPSTLPAEQHSLELLTEKAKNGNRQAIQLFGKIGSFIGIGVNNIINTFNPEQVIIGNRIGIARQFLEKPIEESVHNPSLGFQQQDLDVDFSELFTHSTAFGMAAFAIENFLQVEKTN